MGMGLVVCSRSGGGNLDKGLNGGLLVSVGGVEWKGGRQETFFRALGLAMCG